MPGFSVTLLLLPEDGSGPTTKEQILELLDAQAKTHAWVNSSGIPPGSSAAPAAPIKSGVTSENQSHAKGTTSGEFIEAVRRACKELITAEPEITRMDQVLSFIRIYPHIFICFLRSQVMETVGPHSSLGPKVCRQIADTC